MLSREKPLVKPTAPGSLSHIFAFAIYFSFAFIFRSIKPKLHKYLAAIYLFRDLFIPCTTFISRYLPILRRRTRKGFTTPVTRRVASISYLCAGVFYMVWGGSPTGSITLVSSLREIPTIIVCIIPSSLGKYRRSSSRHQIQSSRT